MWLLGNFCFSYVLMVVKYHLFLDMALIFVVVVWEGVVCKILVPM